MGTVFIVQTPPPGAQEGTFNCPGHLEITMKLSSEAGAGFGAALGLPAGMSQPTCRGREVLDRIGDKWSLHVLAVLNDRTLRFGELRREIDGISQRMLTVTLRTLERDGIVTRTMYPVMPPRVDYALTTLGKTMLKAAGAFILWAEAHVDEIETARADYDALVERVAEAAAGVANGAVRTY
jgi:DNA-binding HxlR family transcriptional regulator